MLRLLFSGLVCALALGCAGYRVGPTNGVEARSKTITIQPFQNKTLEPRLSQAVSTALRKSLQRDGTYDLETRTQGDILLTGEIKEFQRDGVTYNPNDILTLRDMELFIFAHIKAVETSTGRVLFDRDITGRSIVRAGDNFTSVERQAAPLIAEDLAYNITSLLVDGDW